MEKSCTYPQKAPPLDVIHIDMDAFFAAVEQRDFPEYRGKPIVVGGTSKRGVVAAASYEARKFGIHSAMPSAKAAKLCPELIFVRGRHGVYNDVSDQIMSIFARYTNLVQPLSWDEAFLDLSEYIANDGVTLKEAAAEIKDIIFSETALTASAGVSYNKFLAKVASGYDKPNGLFCIPPEDAQLFKASLPIKKIPGIGNATRTKMNGMGIATGGDIIDRGRSFMKLHFGKRGEHFSYILNDFYYNPVTSDRIRKSLGAERTFEKDIVDKEVMEFILDAISEKVASGLKRKRLAGRTVTLKIKSNDFMISSRSASTKTLTSDSEKIGNMAKHLLNYPILPPYPVRLLGISISNLESSINDTGDQLILPF